MPELDTTLDPPGPELQTWLEQTAKQYGCTYLLAHAENGVIWGRFDDGALATSNDAFPEVCRARLRLSTLWEARLFGPNSEVYLWRGDNRWSVRLVRDIGFQAGKDYLPEEQMLWGTRVEGRNLGFTLVADGGEGLRHAVPISDEAIAQRNGEFVAPAAPEGRGLYRPLRLHVRHYIDYDEAGNARVAVSRLEIIK